MGGGVGVHAVCVKKSWKYTQTNREDLILKKIRFHPVLGKCTIKIIYKSIKYIIT